MSLAPPFRAADRSHLAPVFVLFLLCLLPEGVLIGADLGLWGSPHWRPMAWQYGGFWIGLLGNWRPNYPAQPWLMFVTYGFLHGGFMHFAVNMLTLFSLGRLLSERFGAWRFLLIYVLSMFGGAAAFALLSNSPQPMVGASGALFGLAGAHVALAYRIRREIEAGLWPVIRAILLLVALNVVMWWAMAGQLAWETHLGGFLVGAALALFLRERD